MKSEEEARKCWCPFARAIPIAKDGLTAGMGAFNRYGSEGDNEMTTKPVGQCIASECMAWRWEHGPTRLFNHTTGLWQEPGTLYESRDRTELRLDPDFKPTLGYCGLAGRL